jgi:hypothetical protein
MCLSVLYLYYLPVDSHHQHKPKAEVSDLISVPSDFPGPSQWQLPEQSLKTVVLKNLLALDHSG